MTGLVLPKRTDHHISTGRRYWNIADLHVASDGLSVCQQPRMWEVTASRVRWTTPGPLEPAWYRVQLSIRSHSRFTVQKRCELIFETSDQSSMPAARETFHWNQHFAEDLVVRLTRPARGIRLELFHAEGTLTLEAFEVTRLSSLQVAALAVREKVRLIRAYRCTGPVLWRGAQLLLRGQWRQFGAKILKGLIDSRQIRLGHHRTDEVDAAWWRRHTLTKDEAEQIARECDSWTEVLPVAVIIPVDPGKLEPARWAAHSVRRQIYPHWELYLVTAGPRGVVPHLEHLLPPDPRIRVVRVPRWAGLSMGIGKALAATECRWTILLPPGLELAEHALYHWVKRLRTEPTLEVVGAIVARSEHVAQSIKGTTDNASSSSSSQLRNVPETNRNFTHQCSNTNSTSTSPTIADPRFYVAEHNNSWQQISGVAASADHNINRSPESTSANKHEVAVRDSDGFPIPQRVWAVATPRLARLIPARLALHTVAPWTETLSNHGDGLLDQALAYPIEERPLMEQARVGRKPHQRCTPLFLSTDLKGISGYDHLAYAILKGLPCLGVELRWHQVSAVLPELMPRGIRPAAGGWKAGDKQLIISPPFLAERFQPDEASALFTMWETDHLEPRWVAMMNRCRVVIVPSHWGAECLRRCGVEVPVEVVPLGYDPVVYHPGTWSWPLICTFGTAGALAAGGIRKNAQRVIDLFRRAFPHESDVRLRVKITPQSPAVETYDDPRINVIRAILPVAQVAEWYRSLTVYVNASAGEGFGLHLLEAMACGRPLISAAYSGLTMFFDEKVGYSVPYRLVPVRNAIYSGQWAEPDEEALIAQMRHVYAHSEEAREYGMRAACRARCFTWRDSGRLLRDVLIKHGFIQ
ncbi:MAG: glycosyltransferase [Thermogemmata sp.]|nr:glycosyltransferase [Thermogemmata sp.]